MTLPSPPWAMEISLHGGEDQAARLDLLPPRAGIFVIQTGPGGVQAFTCVSNVRRGVQRKLAVADFSGCTVRWLTVGSAFEADWAFLQHARVLQPATYRSLMDRWQAWFIHCDPAATHPQWIKSPHPSPGAGIWLGPFRDKHAPARFIEHLQDIFDLCRYHHILVQAPRGVACAYKEMGRCPAPCDGSVSLDAYRRQINDSIRCASDPPAWRHDVEGAMEPAALARDFEAAARLKQQLKRAAPLFKPQFAILDRIERFRFLAVMPSEQRGWSRLFVINGGWIAPLVDLPRDSSPDQLEAALLELLPAVIERPVELTPQAIENIGMVCTHLFRAAERPSARSPSSGSTTHRRAAKPPAFLSLRLPVCILDLARRIARSMRADGDGDGTHPGAQVAHDLADVQEA